MKPQERCVTPDELDALAMLKPTDRQWDHVRACPRCRALVEAHRLFHSPSPEELEAAHTREADLALTAHLAALTAMPIRAASPAREPWWRLLFAPAMRPALAMATVTVVVAAAMLWPRIAPQELPSELRGGPGAKLTVVLLERDADRSLTLRWNAIDGATQYRIEFYSAALERVADTLIVGTTSATIPNRSRLGATTADAQLVRVVALNNGDVLVRSDTAPLPR